MNGPGRRVRLTMLCLAGGALLSGGCKPAAAPEDAAVEEPGSESVAESPAPGVGRHALTASPPVTVPDLDRLVDLGFNSDEIAAEISRRGVLRLPEPGERERIQRLPRGDRLLELMELPANLLTAAAAARFGERQAGAPNIEQWQAARNNTARTAAYPTPTQVSAVRQQQLSDYQWKRTALTGKISALKRQRTAMQQRGEMVGTINIEIDRLERELGALVPPA